MKRAFSLLIAFSMLSSLLGCTGTTNTEPDTGTSSPSLSDIEYGGGLFSGESVHKLEITYVTAADADTYDAYMSTDSGEKIAVTVSKTQDSDGNNSLTLTYGENGTCGWCIQLHALTGDKTCLKDYAGLRIMSEAGVSVPLSGFAEVYINSEKSGLFLAVECFGAQYLHRVFGESYGNLYVLFESSDNSSCSTDSEVLDSNSSPLDDTAQSYSQGASLTYTDDDFSSYSGIFQGAVTEVSAEDKQRLIASLKALSEGENISSYVNTDEVISYFAADNFTVNDASYTGATPYNYALYENNGLLSMLPESFLGAFGTLRSDEDASKVVNMPIYSPLTVADGESRPMWENVMTEENLSAYAEVLSSLVQSYFSSGSFEKEMQELYEMLRLYVSAGDVPGLSVESFEEAVKNFVLFCTLRAQSVHAQLDGTLSPTAEERKCNKSGLVSCEGLLLSAMR